jgi:cyclic pyranopterin phosphate synthase
MEGVSLKGHDDILRYEEILRVVSRAVTLGFVKVRLTGGEPLVRRGFVEFATDLKKIKGLEDISLTTNGILLEKYADGIFNAGITRINISLDSLDRDKYAQITRGGNLADVFRGIAAAEKAGFSPIKINTVIIKGFNDNEVLDFARLALAKPFQVRFIEIMPVSQVNAGCLTDFLPNHQLQETIGRHFRLEPKAGKKHKSDGPAKIFTLPDGQGEIGFINPVSDHFCATCNRLRLMADGKLRACLLKDEEVDIRAALRQNCDDDELDALICRAIRLKPEKHDLDCTDRHLKKCHRDMSDIGG